MPAFSSMTARAAGCGLSLWLVTVAYSVPTARFLVRRSRPTIAVARLGLLRLKRLGAGPARVGRSGKAAGESGICRLQSAGRSGASARAGPARGGGRRFSKKNPPLATGRSLGRNGKVSRFVAAPCVTIHTRRGQLLGIHRDDPKCPVKEP